MDDKKYSIIRNNYKEPELILERYYRDLFPKDSEGILNFRRNLYAYIFFLGQGAISPQLGSALLVTNLDNKHNFKR